VTPNLTSVHVALLNFLEQDNLKRLYDPSQALFFQVAGVPSFNPAQLGAATTSVNLFLCPSEPQPIRFTRWGANDIAGTNYMANTGTGIGVFCDPRFPTDGVCWNGSNVKWSQITDGSSNTLFMAEALLGSNFDTMGSTPGSPRQVASPQGLSSIATGGTTPALSDAICAGTGRWVGDRGLSWIYGLAQSTTFNTYFPPNSPIPDCHTNGQGRFKSNSGHSGGVNVVYCDGTVRFVSNGITLATWQALSTRAGGETVNSLN